MKTCDDIPQMYREKLPYCDTGYRQTDCAPYCCDSCHYYHADSLYKVNVDGEQYYVCCAVRRYFIPRDERADAETEKIIQQIFGDDV